MRLRSHIVLLAALAACTGGNNATQIPDESPPRRDGAIVVASFNFTESQLVAEIYAQALEHAGIPVQREFDLGARELVQPALAQGFVDVVPEYLGTALRSVSPDAPADPHDPEAVRAALASALAPWGLVVLEPAVAQDQNGLVMTTTRANAFGVRSISELVAYAPSLVLGGPPECPTRPLCLVGLEQLYGLGFASFSPFTDLRQEQIALEQGVIDVAVMFTTDGRLADPKLRLLDDDRRLQPAENIVPVVSARAVDRFGPQLTATLDAISRSLTSANLTFLNWRVDVAGKDVATEAAGWLARHPPA